MNMIKIAEIFDITTSVKEGSYADKTKFFYECIINAIENYSKKKGNRIYGI